VAGPFMFRIPFVRHLTSMRKTWRRLGAPRRTSEAYLFYPFSGGRRWRDFLELRLLLADLSSPSSISRRIASERD
jgi:hypothetical protein